MIVKTGREFILGHDMLNLLNSFGSCFSVVSANAAIDSSATYYTASPIYIPTINISSFSSGVTYYTKDPVYSSVTGLSSFNSNLSYYTASSSGSATVYSLVSASTPNSSTTYYTMSYGYNSASSYSSGTQYYVTSNAYYPTTFSNGISSIPSDVSYYIKTTDNFKAYYGPRTTVIEEAMGLPASIYDLNIVSIAKVHEGDNLAWKFELETPTSSTADISLGMGIYITAMYNSSETFLAATTFPQYTFAGTNGAHFTYYLYF